jgi:predicted RNA-binding protein YlxR (DUF448 family)
MGRMGETSERTCIVTRVTLPVDSLVRFVVAPGGSIVPDLRHRLPGRGVWVTAERWAVEAAVNKRLFGKALDGVVTVDADLPEVVDRLMFAAAAAALSLARKAGALVAGFSKVEAALAGEPVVALIHAAEARDDGVSKLEAAARRRFGTAGLETVRCFGSEQLDLAFGRTNVIHAAVLAGPAGANLLARVGALFRYRSGNSSRAGSGERSFDASTELNELSLGTVGTP